ncbi:sugar ABC transporter substrate-binding protein [Paenibacillus sp. MWE-103]|uniref:Sugar ABC transporter substrate-binding protein n=1 Tax=Paenibacillus artemisiicola TaxID=1172618 RepID=A0ABS3WBN9_9BACL|nr:sugar ABC transporter substrate-binding protein [Paenibacillus artemisiicola]MBO7745734.1 sugar ABC transporter substrate-binding protein [Paenibacillus artemisiicola]
MKRNKYLLLLGALVTVMSTGVLTACSSNDPGQASATNSTDADTGADTNNGTDTNTASDKPVTINYFDWTDEQPYMDQILSAFQQKYPNIKVNASYVPSSDYIQKILVNLSTGGGDMDVFATQSTSNLAEYVSKQVLEPLDDITSSPDLAGISEPIGQLKFDDHIFGLPYRTSKWMLYYNKDLFDKAGLTYPDASWTWDQYADTAKKLTSGSGQNKTYGSMSYQSDNTWWRVLANIEGANNPLNPEELPKFKQVMEYYFNLTYTDGAQQPFGELVGNAGADYAGRFLQGNTAMMWNGDWAVQQLNDAIQQKGVKLNYDIAPLPHWKDSEPATTGSFAVVMVNKETENMDASKKLATFIASEEAAKIIAGNGLLTPWSSDAVKQAFLTKVTTPEHAGIFSDNTKVLSQVPMDPLYNQGMNIMKEESSLYLLKKQSLDKTMQNIEDRIKKEVK